MFSSTLKKENSRQNKISWCVSQMGCFAIFSRESIKTHKMIVIFLLSSVAGQCPFGKGTLMEIVDLGMNNGLSVEIEEIFWTNPTTRKFMDELILNCRHRDSSLVKMLSPRDRRIVLKVFDNAQMLDQVSFSYTTSCSKIIISAFSCKARH